ncbi:leucine-rich repeat extensin-like protein 2 [Rutidosis leptorrhynchoides]|uniref:leucine-rich repeat extensin-like protein 2 n=1 Tax=Rutidosis leptorrhynchoides TaxID=125765 RepID=UPI003A990A27
MPPPYLLLTLLFSASVLHLSTAADNTTTTPALTFENPRLIQAYIALQAWKQAIMSDPFGFTFNWIGPNVCSYTGVYCAPFPFNPSIRVVAGIDLNHANIEGYLPHELGLLTDLALFHISSNQFCGTVPITFKNLRLLHELDLSNNRFVGLFPIVALSLPHLKFLDLRFNEFEGPLPHALFDKNLDAVFLNDNQFRFGIPKNLGNSPVYVLVPANNDLGGCIPPSIGKMRKTLNEIILMNNNLTGCIPVQVGLLKQVTVFDVSFNNLQGLLPGAIAGMRSVEQLNVAHNRLTGVVHDAICRLPRLLNFTYSFNYFMGEAPSCSGGGKVFDDGQNCIVGRMNQRSVRQCSSRDARPVDCRNLQCGGSSLVPRPPRPPTTGPIPMPPSGQPSPQLPP